MFVGGVMDYLLGSTAVGLSAAFGPLVLAVRDIRWSQFETQGRIGVAVAVLRGVLLAILPVLLFAALFRSADAGFDRLVRTLLDVDLNEITIHLIVIGLITWIVAGWGRQLVIEQPWNNFVSQRSAPFTIGMVETTIMLGALVVLFATFVVLQIEYLFGGVAFVEASRDFTYAEYARRGFFELVWVAMLSLTLLLVTHWLVRPTSGNGQHVFVTLVAVLIALLYVIMLSAVLRMALYTSLYGLTELRLYTTAFMTWLAVVFAWFVATVLRGQRRHFAVGAVVAGFVTVAVLNGINPDGLIARTNLTRADSPRPPDGVYLTSLSADAVPAIVAGLSALPTDEQQRVQVWLARRWSTPPTDWRSWNWSRGRAVEATAGASLIDPNATNLRSGPDAIQDD
jgi:hypothetical protein